MKRIAGHAVRSPRTSTACAGLRRANLRYGAAALLAAVAAAAPASAAFTVAAATGNATPVAGGAAFAYTITVTNTDAVNPATDVVMTDPLPPSVLFQNIAIGGSAAGSWSCATPAVGANGLVECRAPSVPASGVATFTLVVQIDRNVAAGVRTNTARVVADGSETSGSIGINIQVNAPLSINKTGPANVVPGDYITYLITLNNGGQSTALNAIVSDPLPAYTSFVSLVGTGPFLDGCSVTPGNVVTCGAIDVPSGLHYLTLRVKTSPGLPAGNLQNVATITSAGTGTIAVGNSATNANVAP